MDENSIESILNKIGLSNHEIKVYLFLIKNNDLPAYRISKEVLIPRTTVYKILDNLKYKDLVTSWRKNGTLSFMAENPNKLLLNIKNNESNLLTILPDLIGLFSKNNTQPTVRIFTGREGCKDAFEIILDVIKFQKIKKLYAYSDSEITNLFPKYYLEWRNRKNKTEAFTYLLLSSDTAPSNLYKSDPYRQTKIVDKKYNFSGSINLCGTYSVFFSFNKDEPYAIVLDSKVVADMLTTFFGFVWDNSEGIV